MKLTAQDLMLFIGQEVETCDGNGVLIGVNEKYCEIRFPNKTQTEEYGLHISEVKPICRKWSKIEPTKEGEEIALQFENNNSEKITDLTGWEGIKFISSKGICLFNEWFEQGLVIEKVKEHA